MDPEQGLEHLLALRQMDIGIGDLSSAFKVPREWILLERTLLLLTGLCTLLDPNIRPMHLIRPYIKQFLLGDGGDWSEFVVTTSKELFVQYVGLPTELRRFLTRASTGRLETRVKGLKDGHRMLYALGHQLIYTAIGIAAVSLATVYHLNGEYDLAQTCSWVAGGAGLFLVGSIWRQSKLNR